MIWNEVRNKGDIDYLLWQYGGFNDACLKELKYISGAYVDENETMYYGSCQERQVSLIFNRQWEPSRAELLFSGVRKCSIAGWQETYTCDIYGIYLAFRDDLVLGKNMIVWADTCNFDLGEETGRMLLSEPMPTYLIAESLKWRFLE